MIEKAFAKINLTLNVVGRRKDGYHDLIMIMSPISLCDELLVEAALVDEVVCSNAELSGEKNIVYKAIKLLKSSYNISQSVKITITKNIPVGAGLGGGSADCAAALRALNVLWSLNLSLKVLANIGSTLWAYVPFCIYNRPALFSGIGNEIEFLNSIKGYVVLFIPHTHISTGVVFENTHKLNMLRMNIDNQLTAVNDNDISSLRENLFNNLQDITLELDETCRKTYEKIILLDDKFMMTGSGSVFFAIYSDVVLANKIILDLEEQGIKTLQSKLTTEEI